MNAANWFLGKTPTRVTAMGGVYRFKDGREVPDHVYAIFEYPGSVTGTFTSLESNAFDEYYEAYFGTKGTLIIRNENDALLFDEGEARAAGIEMGPKGAGAALETSETKPHQAGGNATAKAQQKAGPQAISPSSYEVDGWAAAIRTGKLLNCGPEKAMHSASWTIAANESIKTGQIVTIP